MRSDDLTIEHLRLLALLYRTHSLKAAGAGLSLTGPTASRMLSRLREVYDDELFIRSASLMVPSRLCEDIIPKVMQILAAVDSLDRKKEVFVPGTTHRTFQCMMHEQLFTAHFAAVEREIAAAAPDVRFNICGVSDDGPAKLKTGELDFLIFPKAENFTPDVRVQELCTMHFKILVRKGHPWLSEFHDGQPNWQRLSHYRKIQTTIDSYGTRAPGGLDNWLLKELVPRQETAVWVPYVHAAAELLLTSDLTMIVYGPLADYFCRRGDFVSVDLAELGGDYSLGFYWHARLDADPALQWLRAMFYLAFNQRKDAAAS